MRLSFGRGRSWRTPPANSDRLGWSPAQKVPNWEGCAARRTGFRMGTAQIRLCPHRIPTRRHGLNILLFFLARFLALEIWQVFFLARIPTREGKKEGTKTKQKKKTFPRTQSPNNKKKRQNIMFCFFQPGGRLFFFLSCRPHGGFCFLVFLLLGLQRPIHLRFCCLVVSIVLHIRRAKKKRQRKRKTTQ